MSNLVNPSTSDDQSISALVVDESSKIDRRTKATQHRDLALRLNVEWNVGALQSRYSNDGNWYAILTKFPAALFDYSGYLKFETQEEYQTSPHIKIKKQISVRKPGISAVPGYVKMRVAIDTNLPDADLHEFEATEGYAQLVIHLRRERSKDLVKRKKAAVKSFACEVCNFDFSKKYGAISSQYCEVHHLQPIGSMTQPKKTRLQDLAILCANCHRVIHLRNPPFTIAELRISIANNTIISDPPVDFI